MIVSSDKSGWKIINQRSHGLLAAMIGFQYDINLPTHIKVPTLIAIAEHDDGVWETKQAENLTEAGAPKDFRVQDDNTKTDLTRLHNIMEISSAKSQLNALLTSLHLDFLYKNRKKGEDKNLDNFINEQQKHRKNILKNLNIDKKYSDQLYRLLEWCDAFSLLICLDKIQPEGRKMEISKSPDGQMNQTFFGRNKEIKVEPWVFKEDKFSVFYEYKIIEQLKFKNTEEFNKICSEALVQREEFIISK